MVTGFAYNARDQLLSVTEAGQSQGEYRYNHLGMRIEKLGERGVERSSYDGKSLLVQNDAAGQLLARFRYGAGRLHSLDTGAAEPEYYLFDGLGSAVTTAQADGNVISRNQFDAWGNKRAESGSSWNRFGFTGHEHDEETGLIYAKARFYDPDTGRFLSHDPWEGDVMVAPSLHKYLYAYGNPTVWVDPTGQYNEAGHYYTTMIVAMRVGYSPQEAAKIAMYAQLPDEVARYDAISVVGQTVLSDGIQFFKKNAHRSQVQRGHHVLSGSNADSLRDAALGVIANASRNDYATIGVAIHPLGDSFSHRRLDDSSKTYSQGLGHAFDGTTPDVIHLRREKYSGLVESLAISLAGKNDRIITSAEIDNLQNDLWARVESAKVPEARVVREYTQSGWFEDIRYPIQGTVDKDETNKYTIRNLRMYAIQEYASRAGISREEATKLMLKPEDNSFPAHGIFSQGEGDEVSDIHDLLETRPSDDNFFVDYWKKRNEAKGVFEKLEPAAKTVADEIIENGIND